MPYYMLLATDSENTAAQRAQARPAHLARLQALQAEGRLLTAGSTPMADQADQISGSLIIAAFDSLDAAQTWAEQDPYAAAGVYSEILIKPYEAVFK